MTDTPFPLTLPQCAQPHCPNQGFWQPELLIWCDPDKRGEVCNFLLNVVFCEHHQKQLKPTDFLSDQGRELVLKTVMAAENKAPIWDTADILWLRLRRIGG